MDLAKIRQNAIEAIPALKQVIEIEPTVGGCDLETCQLFIYCIVIVLGLFVIALIIGLPTVYVIYYRQTKELKKKSSTKTDRMNSMLFRALNVHLCLVIIFLIVPLFAFYGLMLSKLNVANMYIEIVLNIAVFHSIADFFAIIYFIRPYRMFIIEILAKFLRNFGCIIAPTMIPNRIYSHNVIHAFQ